MLCGPPSSTDATTRSWSGGQLAAAHSWQAAAMGFTGSTTVTAATAACATTNGTTGSSTPTGAIWPHGL